MAQKGTGTNFFTANGDANVYTALTNEAGNAMLVYAPTASIPSAVANYGVGCILSNTTTGSLYFNKGTTASCTFQEVVS